MERREYNILKYRYITPTEWEQKNGSEEQYFENGVKKTPSEGYPYCCSETIIENLAESLNNLTIPKAYKNMKNEGKIIEYIFVLEKENRIIKINIPTSLIKDEYCLEKYPFIRNDIKQYDKICKLSQDIRKAKNVREAYKKSVTAILSAATLAISYAGTRKVINELTKPAPSMEHYTYNQYYGNVMAEEDFNEKVEALRKSYEKTQEKYRRK